MKFAVFDHVDRSDQPFAKQFDERLAYVAAADEAGFYAYHVAEHHATPLNMVPVPGVYLGAVARATRRIRIGPLVYLLPLYSPLRLIEEIAMLDHLCHGRLEVGDRARRVAVRAQLPQGRSPRPRARFSSTRSTACSPA